MQSGLSQVMQQMVHARTLDYGECGYLQVVCPACAGPLHKRGQLGAAVQYLAHFANKEADCEERVRRILLTTTEERAHTAPRLPPLESMAEFLARFEEIMIDHAPCGGQVETFTASIDIMRRRPTLRKFVRANREVIQRFALLRASMSEGAVGWQAPWINMAIRFLTRGNTEPLCNFAICYDALMRATFRDSPSLAAESAKSRARLDAVMPGLTQMDDIWLAALLYCETNGLNDVFKNRLGLSWTLFSAARAVANVAHHFVTHVGDINTWEKLH